MRITTLLLATFLAATPLCSAGRELWGGRSYIRINIGELFLAMRTPSKPGPLGRRIVFRGKIFRRADLDRKGFLGIMRTAIVCCVMDANVLGIKLVHTRRTRRMNTGRWVKVYGRLIKQRGPALIILKNSSFNVAGNLPKFAGIRGDYTLIPDRIVPIPKPKDYFITKWKKREPYVY